MGVFTTMHCQTSVRPVQELNVCTVDLENWLITQIQREGLITHICQKFNKYGAFWPLRQLKVMHVLSFYFPLFLQSVRCDQESGIVQLASNAVEDLIKLVRDDAVLVGGAQHKCSLDDNGEPKSFIRNVLQAFAVRETLRIYTVETT